ncbi:hypothetical protein C1646_666057 [Rhizophagus diaphanus]|nr:hypothetical protein C1646_666057 [Rhizophagus diaphanus] [Rhizophagus sp. MUCL 43196]
MKGYHTCSVSHNSLTDLNQDLQKTSRYHHVTDNQFKEILQESNVSAKKCLCSQYNLRPQPSILDNLKRDRHLQTPQDIYHATAGKIRCLLKLTCELFSREGEDDFIKIWKDFEKPKKYSHLPNPISHHASFMMSDYFQLAMIMPFLLYRFLKVFADFINLPNLHINMHLLMHAQTFRTLINTQVGIKEMVQRIFKGIVPSTNHKDIDLNLIK